MGTPSWVAARWRALAALLIPLLKLERWRYALETWVHFWSLTVIFVHLPAPRYERI